MGEKNTSIRSMSSRMRTVTRCLRQNVILPIKTSLALCRSNHRLSSGDLCSERQGNVILSMLGPTKHTSLLALTSAASAHCGSTPATPHSPIVTKFPKLRLLYSAGVTMEYMSSARLLRVCSHSCYTRCSPILNYLENFLSPSGASIQASSKPYKPLSIFLLG
jgi:hypothetical protein